MNIFKKCFPKYQYVRYKQIVTFMETILTVKRNQPIIFLDTKNTCLWLADKNENVKTIELIWSCDWLLIKKWIFSSSKYCVNIRKNGKSSKIWSKRWSDFVTIPDKQFLFQIQWNLYKAGTVSVQLIEMFPFFMENFL